MPSPKQARQVAFASAPSSLSSSVPGRNSPEAVLYGAATAEEEETKAVGRNAYLQVEPVATVLRVEQELGPGEDARDDELEPLCSSDPEDEDGRESMRESFLRQVMLHADVCASPTESDPLERRLAELEAVSSFKEVKTRLALHLEKADIQGLPDSIDTLRRLQRLNLQENCISELPRSFSNLRTLQEVILADNALTGLPEGFGDFPQMRLLRLERNRLASLPDTISGMRQLRWLELQDNRLVALPNGFCQLGKLEMLRVEGNQLTTLPEGFGELQALRWLRLSNNQLTRLPGNFAKLAALESMHAEGNLLAALPCSFGGLASLCILDLENNALSALPETFAQLKALRSLRVSGNCLSKGLPWGFEGLRELEDFDLGPLNTLRELWQRLLGRRTTGSEAPEVVGNAA